MLDKKIIGIDLGGIKIQTGQIRQSKIEQEYEQCTFVNYYHYKTGGNK